MANNPRITVAAANAMLNAGIGTPAAAGYIRIYDGTQPPNGGDPITTQNLLVTLTFSSIAFPAASGGVIIANPITAGTAVFSSTATWARILQSDGVTVLFDCSVGTSAADIILNTTTIVSGSLVSMTSLTVTDYTAAAQVDVLGIVRLDPSLQGNTHLTGSQGSIYTFVDVPNGLTWYMKGSGGFPWDGKPYDSNYAISDFITENSNHLVDTSFKNWETPIPLAPRFYTVGSGQWQHLVTGTPLFDIHDPCNTITTHNLGPQVLGTFEGPFNRDFGGDIGVRDYYLTTYNYNWNGSAYVNSEHLFFVGAQGGHLALGWVRWELWTNGVLVQVSDFNLIRSGSATLDFPCSIPAH